MRITIDATSQELADEGEVIRAHLDELLSGNMALAKSGVPTIKPHPVKAINEITDTWLKAYGQAMAAMNDSIEKLLLSFVEADGNPNGPA